MLLRYFMLITDKNTGVCVLYAFAFPYGIYLFMYVYVYACHAWFVGLLVF